MADYLVLEEDGTSHLELEENTDDILLEESGGWTDHTLNPSDSVSLSDRQLLSPTAQVSQEPVEVVVTDASPAGRISQEPVEVIVTDAVSQARASQEPVEVVVTGQTDSPIRTTQQYIEAAVTDNPAARVTQQYTEVVLGNERVARVTQQYIEVVYSYGRPKFIPRVWMWF